VHYAIIGCIHGNSEALKAVLADIRQRQVERIVCLGDVVGYGPDPIDCLRLVKESCFISIKGDHDAAILEGTSGFIKKTALGLEWTKRQIDADESLAGFLEEARDTFSSAGISFCHGSPRSPHEYLFPRDVKNDPRKIAAAFNLVDKVCFVTHTHVPGVIVSEPLGWLDAHAIDGYFHYTKGTKAIVNVGSVGQPRDGDPRACYLEIKKNEMRWRRVEYDVGRVVNRLASIEALSSDLAIRLQKGR